MFAVQGSAMLKWIESLVDVANPVRNEEVKKYTASAALMASIGKKCQQEGKKQN
jgi:hypothetical protein